MAIQVLTDAVIWVHDADFTGVTNQVSVQASVEDQDATVFGGAGYKARLPGLRNVEANVQGYFESVPDASVFTNISTVDHAVTIAPLSTEGAKAFSFQAGRFNYEAFGAVGDVTPFTLDLQGSNTIGVVRGLITRAKGNVSATGVLGTPQQVGAGGAGKFLYATLHVFGTPGTTITVQVQSDNAVGFPSATTQATIGPVTTAGGTFMTRVNATAITDDWWRFNVSAITGTFTVAGMIAVQ